MSGHGDLRQLERHVLGVPGDLGTDLDELLLQRCQRPLPHALWKCWIAFGLLVAVAVVPEAFAAFRFGEAVEQVTTDRP